MSARVVAVVPCRDRRQITLRGVADLVAQEGVDLHVVLVDDGSSDGTAEAVRARFGDVVTVLEGDGELWWTGAIVLGLAHIVERGMPLDYVLLQNDDTHCRANHVRTLVDASRAHGDAAVGSPVRELDTDRLISIGPMIDWHALLVRDALEDRAIAERFVPGAVVEVDTLSGRGTLIPWQKMRDVGGVRPKLFPHYCADYDLGVRLRRAHVATVIAHDAPVWTGPPRAPPTSLKERALARGSPANVRDLNLLFLALSPPARRPFVAARLAARLGRLAVRGVLRRALTMTSRE